MCCLFNIQCMICCESKLKIVYNLVYLQADNIQFVSVIPSCLFLNLCGQQGKFSNWPSKFCYLADKELNVTMHSRNQRYSLHHCQCAIALIIWTTLLSLHTGCANHHRSKSKFSCERFYFYINENSYCNVLGFNIASCGE
jgi:hypothetical protein